MCCYIYTRNLHIGHRVRKCLQNQG
jgi:hypothetical protein